MSQGSAQFENGCLFKILNEEDGMGDACIQGVDLQIPVKYSQGVGQLKAVRFTYPEADSVVRQEFRSKYSCLSQEGEVSGGESQKAGRETGKTARSIAAHLNFTSIRIVITHPG